MRRWHPTYRSKLTTPERALESLPRRARVYLGGNAATPRRLAEALARRADDLDAVSLAHVLLLGEDPIPTHAHARVRHHAWFAGPADRAAINSGDADYVPVHLSEIPRMIRSSPSPLDAALLMTSPPDDHGFLSLGVEVMASLSAAESARRVIVQVNEQMPRVLGNSFIHLSQVDAIVESDEPLPELSCPPPEEVHRAIAHHVLPLIPHGATLQLGIGGIPDAVLSLLTDRDDLGVHSEMVSDGLMKAVESGVVTGRFKTLHPRKVITTFVLGSRELYEWVHENPAIEGHPCDYTNDLVIASSNDRLVALNSAISVDLTGQVNSDSIGHRIYSGFGGQLDFIRAAARSRDGVPIIALPSTANGGTRSRIVPTLAPGAGVVTTRADVQWVVTEHGAANLRGLGLADRCRALIELAHPTFREELASRARELGLLS